ncbi:MFS transporter [Shouchella clausii]|uniref:MFS transporter n=1 Tax=Shouchella clausii TaxID=79880 RepID=UPI0031FC1662
MKRKFARLFENYIPIWGNKDYLWFLLVSMFSLAGDLVAWVITTWVLTTQFDHPAIYLTTLVILTQSAYAIMSPYMGHLVDKWGPFTSLISSTGIRTVILTFLFISLLYIEEGISPWVIVGLMTLEYIFVPLSKQSEFVMIKVLVRDEEQLIPANALQGIQFDASYIIGPLIGGLFVSTIGIYYGLVLNMASFLFLGIVMLIIAQRNKDYRDYFNVEQADNKEAKPKTFIHSLRAGISFIVKTPPMLSILLIGFLWNLFVFGPIEVLYPIFTVDVLESNGFVYGLLMSVNSVGFILGLFLAGNIKWKVPFAMTMGILIGLHGLLYFFIGIVPNIVFVCVILFLGGIVIAPTDIFSKTIRQKMIPFQMLAGVSSVIAFFSFISKPIGAFLVGSLINAYGNQYSGYIMAGLGLILFIACMVISFRPVMKKI